MKFDNLIFYDKIRQLNCQKQLSLLYPNRFLTPFGRGNWALKPLSPMDRMFEEYGIAQTMALKLMIVKRIIDPEIVLHIKYLWMGTK